MHSKCGPPPYRLSFTPTFPPISSAMFDHCSNITIAGGTFNVWERPRSPPSDFRSIRLGDLILLSQMCNEEELTSDVVERRGTRLVQRKVIVGTRKVYRARIFGSQDPMTAVVYEGSQLQKAIYNGSWKAEVEHRQSLRLPFLPQLFGITESRGVNALIYHDEFITIAQFRQLHRRSPLISEYIEYQMARDQHRAWSYAYLTPSIRMSTGRLCYHDLGLESDGRLSWVLWPDLIPWEMSFSITPGTRDIEQQLFSRMDVCDIYALLMAIPSYKSVELSIHDHIPLGTLVTVGGDLLDFQVHFPNLELAKIEFRVGPWRAYITPIRTDITALDTQWTWIVVPAGSEDDLEFSSYTSMDDTRYMTESWISQAPRLLGSGIASGVKPDDLLLIDMVELGMRLHYPEQNTDPPSNMPYLFVSSPAAHFEQDGTVWIEIPPPHQQYYWSFDPLGGEQLGEALAGQLSLPQVTFKVYACGRSWTTAQYDLLRKVHELKGVN
ncbi:hypothetical protein B0H17DRAFT_1216384 [Mycena rosella]|uniref:Uncharacterized protein n=1 Tax=Mycena rosella TaxID=1033263 RepID=A0AAD7CBH4_MYCRO|nr:hypothetical protein B0H17DRAFT_1216384 [Mycena rosella]